MPCTSCGGELSLDAWEAWCVGLCPACHDALIARRREEWQREERSRLAGLERRRQLRALRQGARTLVAIRRMVRPGASRSRGGGVRTGEDFANLMAALMGDVIEGTITPNVANAACNAGRQLLRVVEMQYRYATAAGERTPLSLAPGADAAGRR